jgi:hypothetical protein
MGDARMDGPGLPHIFTEGVRVMLGEFAAMLAGKGRGGGSHLPADWRSRLGGILDGILDGMPCNPVMTTKGLVGSPRMTTPDGLIGYSDAPWEILGILGGVPSGNASCSGCGCQVTHLVSDFLLSPPQRYLQEIR